MDKKFQELDELKKFLLLIKNAETRKIIIQIAGDIVISDSIITNEEKEVINFLKEIWK